MLCEFRERRSNLPMVMVCDAIMGSGKTSAIINYINEHPEKKFLYLSPFRNEATRISISCPGARFVEPSDRIWEYHNSKAIHSCALMCQGRSIASTHKALQYYMPDAFDVLKEQGYTVIVDEAPSVLSQDKTIKKDDIDVMVRAGIACEVASKEYRATDIEYAGSKLNDLYRTFQSRDLVYTSADESLGRRSSPWFWMLSPLLFQKVDEVIILTYLFDRQEIKLFMDMNGIEYQNIGIKRDGDRYEFSETEFYVPDYVKNIPNIIHIEEGSAINRIGKDKHALSMSWYNSGKNDYGQMKNNLQNFFNHKTPGDRRDRMTGFFKEGWGKISGAGYKKSRVSFNACSTNEYKDRFILAYPVNLFANRNLVTFYSTRGYQFDDDGYALTTMIQWIWRSAIRDGHEVWLYLPSKRMRGLLCDWMEEVSAQGS